MALDIKNDEIVEGLPRDLAHKLENEVSLDELIEFIQTGEHPDYIILDPDEKQMAIRLAEHFLNIRRGQEINKPAVKIARWSLGVSVVAIMIALAALIASICKSRSNIGPRNGRII